MGQTNTAEKIPASGILSSFDSEKGEGVVTLSSMKGEAALSYELLDRAGYGNRVMVGAKINCGLTRKPDGRLVVVKILEFRLQRQKS